MAKLLKNLKIGGLRARLLAVVLLAVLPLALLMLVYTAIENNAAQNRVRDDVRHRLDTDVRALQDSVSQAQGTLETFGITYAIQSHDWALTQGNVDRLQALHGEYVGIAVADPAGRVRASSPRHAKPTDISGEEFFQRAVVTRGLVVSDYQTDPLTRRPVIIICMPIYDEAVTRLVAVEYIAMSPARLGERLAAANVFTAEILIDGSGTIVSRRPDLPDLVGQELPEAELVRAILKAKRGQTTAEGIDGTVRQYYFAPVFPNQAGELYLAAGFSSDQLLASERRRFVLTVAAFAGIALLALAAAWMVGTYSVYRPALLLKQTAERLAQGDLTARALLGTRRDEFGALRDEFNSMAESLEAHVAELESARKELRILNMDLEDRVRRRTAELESAVKELDAFSYSVSHDLRSPLRAIDGFSLALLEDYSGALDERGRDDLRRVRHAASRMGELIDSLLRLSRISRQEMKNADVDLSEIAQEVAESLREVEPDRNVTFRIASGVHGQGDAELLHIVLENLMGNAWKFTSKHDTATIEFDAVVENGDTVYRVRDDGAGFEMAYAAKLFGAFQRVHGQAEFPGTGIGLATAARIVHRHGGRIWAVGESEKGATFSFTLC